MFNFSLWSGTIFPFFQSSGKILDFRQFWNIIESGFIMDELLSFSILIEIPPYPWALFASNNWIIFSGFSLSKVISISLLSVWYVLDFGTVLLFCTGWRCLLKNLLNKLAFSKKLVRQDYWKFFAIDKSFKYLPIGFWWRRWIS